MTVYKLTSKVKTTSFIGSPAKGAPRVRIIDGVGYTENDAFVAYARTAGYMIEKVDGVPGEYALAVGVLDGGSFEQIGSPLRDAAVDPHREDYLAPVNAGPAGPGGNPHGSNVVSVQAVSPASGNTPFVSGQRYEPATVDSESPSE
ncbi:hypothetical protein [Arthrobacter sp. TMN-50]